MLPRLILITAGVTLCVAGVVARQDGAAQDPAPQRTTKDGAYTSTQADTGKAAFESVCSKCHAFKPWEKSGLNPDLAGTAFLDKWNTRPVLDLVTVIFTSMPNDGSAFLTEEQSADLTAYILQQNGFPAGQSTLKADASARQIIIVK